MTNSLATSLYVVVTFDSTISHTLAEMKRRLLWSFNLELNAASCGVTFRLLLAVFDAAEDGFFLDVGMALNFEELKKDRRAVMVLMLRPKKGD